MGKLQNNQAGFGVVEGLLILVIVGLVGFTGWYVLHAKAATDKTLTNTALSTPAPTKSIKKSTTTSTSSTTSNTVASNTFKVPELGIEITGLPSSISDLTDYTLSSGTQVDPNNSTTTPVSYTYLQFSTQSLTTADPACSAKTGTSIGALGRTEGTYENNQPEDNTAFVKQFNGFYITYSHPEAACSNSASPEALHMSQTATFQTVATNPDNLKAL